MTSGRVTAALLTLQLAVLAAFGAALPGCRRADRPPASGIAAALPVTPGMNVIVLSFDALRARALGIYGNTRQTSPRIDELARGALVFDRAYTVAPSTPTSFAAAFSGCLPHRVFKYWRFEPPTTLAAVFAAAGYRTAAFLHNPQLTRGFNPGFEDYAVIPPDHTDETALERAVAWLDMHRRERFFVWIHLLTPHAPYRRRDDAVHLYDAGYDGPFRELAPPNAVTIDPADMQRIRTLYDGEVLHADRLFATLSDALRDLDLLDGTLLVLTTDHGEELGEHGWFGHGRLWNEHLHIPLIIRHPQVAEGSRSSQFASNMDLAPTLAAVAGLEWPPGCEGVSLLDPAQPRSTAVSLALTNRNRTGASLRRDDLHLILTCERSPEAGTTSTRQLYDLGTDPEERRDLAVERDELRRTLEAELWSTLGVADCDGLDLGLNFPQRDEIPAATKAALRALGYVDGGADANPSGAPAPSRSGHEAITPPPR